MKFYPGVVGEFDTIRKILDTNCSIARFGDGEVKLMDGGSQVREPANSALARELKQVICHAGDNCLIGIPTMDPRGPKILNWRARESRTRFYLDERVKYYSSFISRPDSAPWILTKQYAEMVCEIWKDKRAAIICEDDSKLLTVLRKTATRKLSHFVCPHRETYAIIDQLEYKIKAGGFEVVIMSCGPAATCLALRLANASVQAIDLGSAGGFLAKMLDLEPLGDLRTVVIRRPEDMSAEEMEKKIRAEWDVRYYEKKEPK